MSAYGQRPAVVSNVREDEGVWVVLLPSVRGSERD